MRQWRMEHIEDMEARLAELSDMRTGLEMQLDDVISEMEDLEYDIEQANEAAYPYGWDEVEADDARERTRDMIAALRDIGSTRL